jgi:hypothetical protein
MLADIAHVHRYSPTTTTQNNIKKKRSYKSEEPGVGAFSINSGLLNACKDGHEAKQQQKRKTTRELKKNKRCRYWMALDDGRCCIDCAKEESSEFVFPSW